MIKLTLHEPTVEGFTPQRKLSFEVEASLEVLQDLKAAKIDVKSEIKKVLTDSLSEMFDILISQEDLSKKITIERTSGVKTTFRERIGEGKNGETTAEVVVEMKNEDKVTVG